MKKLAILACAALVAATSACKKSETPAAEPAASESAAPAEAAAAATTPPGEYVVTAADGKPGGTTTLNADGSYTDTPVKGLAVSGTYAYKDGKICFDPSGDKDPAVCWTESAKAADGSFTATSDKGEKVSVKPKAK